MAAAHFITIPCEPNTALRHKESQIFTILLWTLCSLGLRISILFTTLRFYERCKGFRAVRTMYVPVVIFIPTKDLKSTLFEALLKSSQSCLLVLH